MARRPDAAARRRLARPSSRRRPRRCCTPRSPVAAVVAVAPRPRQRRAVLVAAIAVVTGALVWLALPHPRRGRAVRPRPGARAARPGRRGAGRCRSSWASRPCSRAIGNEHASFSALLRHGLDRDGPRPARGRRCRRPRRPASGGLGHGRSRSSRRRPPTRSPRTSRGRWCARPGGRGCVGRRRPPRPPRLMTSSVRSVAQSSPIADPAVSSPPMNRQRPPLPHAWAARASRAPLCLSPVAAAAVLSDRADAWAPALGGERPRRPRRRARLSGDGCPRRRCTAAAAARRPADARRRAASALTVAAPRPSRSRLPSRPPAASPGRAALRDPVGARLPAAAHPAAARLPRRAAARAALAGGRGSRRLAASCCSPPGSPCTRSRSSGGCGSTSCSWRSRSPRCCSPSPRSCSSLGDRRRRWSTWSSGCAGPAAWPRRQVVVLLAAAAAVLASTSSLQARPPLPRRRRSRRRSPSPWCPSRSASP